VSGFDKTSKNRVLVIGASGLVGQALVRVLREKKSNITGTYSTHRRKGLIPLDVGNARQVRDCWNEVRPGTVFLAAALTHVDYCEDHPREARDINAEGTARVVKEAASLGTKIVFYSTAYVFDGTEGPYSEEADPRPLNTYGRSKLEAEQFIQENIEDCLILRTTVVFGWDRASKNFAMQVYHRLSMNEKMTVPGDQISNPTLADYLAETSVELVRQGANGIVNVVGKDRVSRADFAKALARTFGMNPGLVVPVSTESLDQRAVRPLQGGLCTEKLFRLLGRKSMPLDEALARFRAQSQVGEVGTF
jgi:dTDP-4-dehydrorhamnose reductase